MFDSHTHLNIGGLTNKMKDYQLAGIQYMMIPGVDSKGWKEILEISNAHKGVYGSVGIHPNATKNEKKKVLEQIPLYLQQKKITAVGEIGLDYYRSDNKEEQVEWFMEQLEIAKAHKTAVIIHSREAAADTMEVLDFADNYDTGVILHCYSGSAEMALDYVKRGAYISLAGPVTYQNARTPKEVAKAVPLEFLLIETDSPWLTPHPFRGKKNDSTKLRYIAQQIADLKGISLEEVIKATTANAKKVFSIED